MSKADFSYVNKDGKLVKGTAATIHHIYTEMGGIDNYNEAVATEAIKKALESGLLDEINKALTKNAKKKRFKKIG